jgi:hypothetical protein
MTVADLIEVLEGYDKDTEVFYRVPSHDYWGTELAYPAEEVSGDSITYTDYHRSMKLIDHDKDNEGKEIKEVVLIN